MTRDTIIMVAPNGARKTKRDHAALPESIAATVDEAALCFDAGATALHAHVRGKNAEHLLDAGLYRELLAEMALRVPDMLVQITSEAVGLYSPEQQSDCVRAVKPQMVSIALREITANFDRPEFARSLFDWCGENEVHVQHILYSADDFRQFLDYRNNGVIPSNQRCVLFVLGRYSADFQSTPADLEPFLEMVLDGLDWFVCAFGHQEQQCLLAAVRAGGHARIGFENNLYLADGTPADNTAQLVASLVGALTAIDCRPASSDVSRRLLGVRSR